MFSIFMENYQNICFTISGWFECGRFIKLWFIIKHGRIDKLIKLSHFKENVCFALLLFPWVPQLGFSTGMSQLVNNFAYTSCLDIVIGVDCICGIYWIHFFRTLKISSTKTVGILLLSLMGMCSEIACCISYVYFCWETSSKEL